jgi:hypothetical protein
MQRFTTYNLIYTALRKLGVLNRRDVLKQADLEDGIEAFWTLLDRISNQDLMIPFNQRFVFPVVSTKRIYTVGPGGDFVMPRPIGDPVKLSWRDSVGTDYNITLTDVQGYMEGEPFKETTIGRPRLAYYNPMFPNAELNFGYYPLDTDSLVMWAKIPFTAELYTGGYGCSCSSGCAAKGYDECQCYTGEDECLVADLNYTVSCEEQLQPADTQAVIDQAIAQLQSTHGNSIDCSCSGTLDITYSQGSFTGNPVQCSVSYKAAAKTTFTINPEINEFLEIPPGYWNFLLWHLCIDLAPEYDMEATPTIVARASQAEQDIKNQNDQTPELRMDNSLLYPGKGYNINSGPTQTGRRN